MRLVDEVGGWSNALQRFRASIDRPVLLDRERARAIAVEEPALVEELIEAADQAAQGSFAFFGYPRVTLEAPIDWHYDPFAHLRWPSLPSRRIDHRVADADVKWIWELNRLQHLPLLAEAWLFTGDSRYSQTAFDHLDSWMMQNKTDRGIAWRGAFELGIRSISIAIALQGLRDSLDLTEERYCRYVELAAAFASRCWRDRSLYSSANNHLVGEMAGLAVIAMLFPELEMSTRWESLAFETLSAEASKQILPDGGGAEQAVGYQVFTAELLQLVAVLKAERDGEAPEAITQAVARSCAFLGAVVGSDDPAPRYGDDDEGFALRLGPQHLRTVRDHLSAASCFSWGPAGGAVGDETLEGLWLRAIAASLPVELQKGGSAKPREAPPSALYAKDTGLVVLRRKGQRITMDVGTLGYLSIAAHGHADTLAVTLSVDGKDVIGDPGTGSYYGHPQWRASMRGTRSHSTITIDGQDQSLNVGPFMWSQHAEPIVRRVDLAGGLVEAEHNGYLRLSGVVHRRWLVAPPDEGILLVVDLVTGRNPHEVRSTWPLHPDVDVEPISGGQRLIRGGQTILHVLHAGTAPLRNDDVRGDEASNIGWWSDRLESRVAAWWLGAVCSAVPPIAIATLMANEEARIDNLRLSLDEGVITVRWDECFGPRWMQFATGIGDFPRLLGS